MPNVSERVKQSKLPRALNYNPRVLRRLRKYITDGLSIEDSCALARINRETFYVWKRERKWLREALDRWTLAQKKRCLRVIEDASKKSWQASAWLLERKWTDQYGLKIENKIKGYLERSESEADYKERKKRIESYLAGLVRVPANKVAIPANGAEDRVIQLKETVPFKEPKGAK